jgi:DNA-binding CsgD family transcriptional regulator
MELVGRRPEVDRITTLAGLPRESALVVVGDPGQGKSTLLDAVARRVSIPVVRVGVNASEARWPLSGVTTLFASFDDPRAAAHAGRISQGLEGSGETLAAAHALLDAVRALSLQPTLVLIDDLDRMDEDSQHLIAFLSGRLAGTSLRVVATVRSAHSHGPIAALPSMQLAALDAVDALELAREDTPSEANEGVLAVVASETGGNAKALHEQLRALHPEQLTGVEPIVIPVRPTPTVDAVAAHALAGVASEDVAVLSRIALAPVMQLPLPGIDRDAVEDLVDAGLVRVRGKYADVRDPLVRSHLHWRMPARDRRAEHAALAQSTAKSDPRQALWHASFVSEVVDPIPLLESAKSYAAEGLYGAAVAFTERALAAGTHSDIQQSALLGVAEVLLAQRKVALASRYLGVVRPFRRLAADARRLRLQYAVEYLRGEPVHADELVVPFDVRDADEADSYLGLLAMVASFRAESWELEGAQDLLIRARPLLGSATAATRELITASEELLAAVDGRLPADEELHDGLGASTLSEMADPALLLLGHALSLGERYRSARRVFSIVLGRSSTALPVWGEAVRYLVAENEVRSGNFRQAIRAIDIWDAGATNNDRLREPARALAVAWRHHAEGRSAEAVAVIDQCLAIRSTSQLWGATAKLHALRGRILLLEGSVEEAIPSLETADVISRAIRNPGVLRHLADLVEAYVRVGRHEDARRAAARLATDHHARQSRWGTLALSRSVALVSDDAARGSAVQAALQVFEPSDSPYERARTLHALGAIAPASDRDRFAAAAAAAFEATGMRRPRATTVRNTGLATPTATNASGSASSFGTSPLSPSSPAVPFEAGARQGSDPSTILTMLTAEERQVAQKVTEGFRNKEIASSLYMSQRTVELRLTQIYRKVGARSRSHLVALLT